MSKILIVEDVPDNAELTCRILNLHGYETVLAPDAETGLALAQAEHPDLILLDLGLPDHDGLTLASWLRAEPEFEFTPIIAFTAWPPDTARPMTESYGCNGYIGKPLTSVNDFVEKIHSYLKKD